MQDEQGIRFYEYYQILRDSDIDDDEHESGPGGKREVTGYTTGLHSPFGMLGKIKDARGYTQHQVLWEESWVNLMMEQADAVRYVRGRKPVPVAETREQIEEILGKRTEVKK